MSPAGRLWPSSVSRRVAIRLHRFRRFQDHRHLSSFPPTRGTTPSPGETSRLSSAVAPLRYERDFPQDPDPTNVDAQLHSIGERPEPENLEAWCVRVADVAKSRAFYEMACEARHPEAVERIMATLARTTKISPLHAAAVRRMAAEERFRHAWVEAARVAVPRLLPSSLSRVVYSLGVVGVVGPDKHLMRAWYEAAHANLPDFRLVDLVFAVHGLGLLSNVSNGRIEPDSTFLRLWCHAAIPATPRFNDQMLSNSIYGFALMNCRPSPSFMEAWMAAFNRLLSYGSPSSQAVAVSLYAIAALSISPSPDTSHAIERAVVHLALTFAPRGLTNVLHALSKLRPGIAPRAFHFAREAARLSLHDMNALELCVILNAVARSMHPGLGRVRGLGRISAPDRAWMSEWFKAATARLKNQTERFGPHALTRSIWALHQMKVVPEENFFEEWNRCVALTMEQFSALELSNTLYAITHLVGVPDNRWWHRWLMRCETLLPSFSNRHLVDMLYSVATAATPVPASLTEEWVRCASPAVLQFSARSLGSVCFSLGKLRVTLTEEFLASLWVSLRRRTPRMNVKDIASILGGLTRMGITLPPDVALPMWDALYRQRSALSKGTLRSIFISLQYVEQDVPVHLLGALEAQAQIVGMDWTWVRGHQPTK